MTTGTGPLALAVYGADGRLVRALRSGPAAAGILRLDFDGRDARGRALPAGVYFLRAEGRAWSRVTKVVVSR